MSPALDNADLSKSLSSCNVHLQELFGERYYVKRISVYAITLDISEDDSPKCEALSNAQQEALNRQTADQVDDYQEDGDVINKLEQIARVFCAYKCSKLGSTTVHEQHVNKRRQLSSSHQFSFRASQLVRYCKGAGTFRGVAFRTRYRSQRSDLLDAGDLWRGPIVRVVNDDPETFGVYYYILAQVDCVDCANVNRKTPRKRWRDEVHSPLSHELCEKPCDRLRKSQYKGVRYLASRRGSKKWAAEMKFPGKKDKTWIGSYTTEVEAARSADVAFYYYGKVLNFRDSPAFLPPLAEAIMPNENKMKFVKRQAKLLASKALTSLSSRVPANKLVCTEADSELTTATPVTYSSPDSSRPQHPNGHADTYGTQNSPMQSFQPKGIPDFSTIAPAFMNMTINLQPKTPFRPLAILNSIRDLDYVEYINRTLPCPDAQKESMDPVNKPFGGAPLEYAPGIRFPACSGLGNSNDGHGLQTPWSQPSWPELDDSQLEAVSSLFDQLDDDFFISTASVDELYNLDHNLQYADMPDLEQSIWPSGIEL